MIQAVEITTRLLKENKNYELNERNKACCLQHTPESFTAK